MSNLKHTPGPCSKKAVNMKKYKIGELGQGGTVFHIDGNKVHEAQFWDIGILNWYKAIEACEKSDSMGYKDWYLPSKYELNLMYKNLHLKGVGGFAYGDYYWSSSEYSSGYAWGQYFSFGYQYYNSKANDLRVRAVRVFDVDKDMRIYTTREMQIKKDYDTNKHCDEMRCKYYDEKMELNCSYSADNSKCVLNSIIECEICRRKINDLSGNPSLWGVALPSKNGKGKMKFYHRGCVSNIIERYACNTAPVIAVSNKVRKLRRETKNPLNNRKDYLNCGYNKAIDDVLEILKEFDATS